MYFRSTFLFIFCATVFVLKSDRNILCAGYLPKKYQRVFLIQESRAILPPLPSVGEILLEPDAFKRRVIPDCKFVFAGKVCFSMLSLLKTGSAHICVCWQVLFFSALFNRGYAYICICCDCSVLYTLCSFVFAGIVAFL